MPLKYGVNRTFTDGDMRAQTLRTSAAATVVAPRAALRLRNPPRCIAGAICCTLEKKRTRFGLFFAELCGMAEFCTISSSAFKSAGLWGRTAIATRQVTAKPAAPIIGVLGALPASFFHLLRIQMQEVGGRGPTVVKVSQLFRERNGTNIDLEALTVSRATWAALAKRNKKKIVEIGAFLSEIGAKFEIALSGMIERCVASGAASAQSDASRCALPRPTDAME